MSFLIKDDVFSEKHDKIWKKVSNSVKKEFDSEPVYKEKYLKTKVTFDNRKIKHKFS